MWLKRSFLLHPQNFFSNLEESTTADKALVKRGLQFRENLTKKYKWDFSSEPEDYAPTIVETWLSLITSINIYVSYDSPYIMSTAALFPGSSIWLLAAQKLEGMQYSKHLRMIW